MRHKQAGGHPRLCGLHSWFRVSGGGPPSIPVLWRFGQSREGSAGVRGLSPLSLLPILLSKAAGAQDPVSETSGSPVSGVQRTRTESVGSVLDSLAAFLPGSLSPLSRRGTRRRRSLSRFPDCTLGVRCISVIRLVDGFDCVSSSLLPLL